MHLITLSCCDTYIYDLTVSINNYDFIFQDYCSTAHSTAIIMPGNVITSLCKRIYRIPSYVTCILTVIIQAYIVNKFLVIKYSTLWYTWYIADASVVALFVWAFVDSYKKNSAKLSRTKHKDLFNGKLGLMPLIYITWFLYSVFLAIRVAIIFKWIAPRLDESMMFGPNMLKTGLSLSSIIFFLHVLAHVAAEPKTLKEQYVTGIISRVTMDVLDSVQFLEILFITDSHIFMSFEMHNAIVGIGCINLILPTLKLGILSGWHFGDIRMAQVLETFHLVFYLLVVNLPLLVIRILLWSVHSQDISVFIIKNILSLCMTIKAIHDHFVTIVEPSVDQSDNISMEELQPCAHKPEETQQLQVEEKEVKLA